MDSGCGGFGSRGSSSVLTGPRYGRSGERRSSGPRSGHTGFPGDGQHDIHPLGPEPVGRGEAPVEVLQGEAGPKVLGPVGDLVEELVPPEDDRGCHERDPQDEISLVGGVGQRPGMEGAEEAERVAAFCLNRCDCVCHSSLRFYIQHLVTLEAKRHPDGLLFCSVLELISVCGALLQSDLWLGPIDLAALRDGAPHPVVARAPAWCDERLPRPPVVFVGVGPLPCCLGVPAPPAWRMRGRASSSVLVDYEGSAHPLACRAGGHCQRPCLRRSALKICYRLEIH